ncbi:hypothetical protein Dimus_019139 [Dionaea muscipula]
MVLFSSTYSGSVVEFGTVVLPALEEADVDFRLTAFYVVSNGDRVVNFLVHLKHAKVLSVCSYVTQILATAADTRKLPRRGNARHLIIRTAMDPMEFRCIAYLLNS